MPATGVATITVVLGAVAGWGRLHALGAARAVGRRVRDGDRARVDGFAVPASVEAASEATGVRPRWTELAATLRALAADGPGALYGGAVGARLAAGWRRWAPGCGSTMWQASSGSSRRR